MTIHSRTIDYEHDGVALEAEIAWDDTHDEPRPGVLVCHNWAGRGPNDGRNAWRLAELGYVGFALDLYGKGVLGKTREENAANMQPLLNNREMLQARLLRAHEVMCAEDVTDADRTAVIGFCFGGLCALDMARSNAPIKAAVSFHGLFVPADNIPSPKINAGVLLLHGWDDPMATPDDVLAVTRELSGAGADWQLHAYGGTQHAFTTPGANDPAHGTVFNEKADRRSWQAMSNFLAEVLA